MDSIQNLLVCVTQQKTCERLIREAAAIRDGCGGNLSVLHVAKNDWNFLDNVKEGEALEYLFGISKSVGANLSVLKSDKIVQSICDFAVENRIDCIILGESSTDHKENHFANILKSLLGKIEIKVIP